jgi:hypothetical protein
MVGRGYAADPAPDSLLSYIEARLPPMRDEDVTRKVLASVAASQAASYFFSKVFIAEGLIVRVDPGKILRSQCI